MYKVIVSNGGFRFHLAPAASECNARNHLAGFITAGYPTRLLKKLLNGPFFPNNAATRRLLDREEPGIAQDLIKPIWLTEFCIRLAVVLGEISKSEWLNQSIQVIGMELYGWFAARVIIKTNCDIYHYRAGYGGVSLYFAKKRGIVCLCDHSAVNPAVIEYMFQNEGAIPENRTRIRSLLWRKVAKDIAKADYVVVNSDFVKSTFTKFDFPPERMKVIYLGTDDKFISGVPSKSTENTGPIRIVFAGGVTRRKGIHVLVEALRDLLELDWELVIAGGISEDVRREFDDFFNHQKVKLVGFVSREKLALLMSQCHIFVFPSLAEGSARVVFEAMASGCYVITTPNSGSIVVDGVHGRIVRAGNVDDTKSALLHAFRNIPLCNAIGSRNMQLIREKYTQKRYGSNLDRLYRSLLDR